MACCWTAFVLLCTTSACATVRQHAESGQTPPTLPLHGWRAASVDGPLPGERFDYLEIAGPHPAAPTIVLVHGAFLDHRVWLNFEGLAQTHRVLALRWPDESPRYTGHFSDHTALLAHFLRALEIDTVIPIGVSFGGSVVSQFAVEYADEFELPAIVLVATPVPGSSCRESNLRLRSARTLDRFSDVTLYRLIHRIGGSREFEPAPRPPQAEELFYVRPIRYYRQLFGALESHGRRVTPAEKVKSPVLILHGTEDDTVRLERGREAAKMFPNAELATYEGWTHAMAFLHGPELTQRIERFLVDNCVLPVSSSSHGPGSHLSSH